VFEEAEGGTIFLDEIGELQLELQPMLLRAIERRTTRRLGAREETRHDVRILAATRRNLAEEVRAGRFREDLFFRLSGARVRLPPLRERPEDLRVLADAFALELGTTLSPETLALLTTYRWPGNVRELKNTLARLAACPDVLPLAEAPRDPLLFDDDGKLRPLPEARRLAREDFERRYLQEVIARTGDRSARAAELSGVSRQFLTGLLQKYGLRARRGQGPGQGED
jgi:DNA-binding NtrC family response regulator